MNYFSLTNTVLALSDRRGDTELEAMLRDLTKLVEARLNRALRVGSMSTRSQTITFEQDYYALPLDMLAIRDIELVTTGDDGDSRVTLQYLSPEQANNYSNVPSQDTCFYTIIANQFHLVGQTSIGKTIEIVYYQTIRPIYEGNDDNWLSYRYPDAYINGLMVEIMSYTKDAGALQIWEQRFTQTINEINDADASDRWSGTALQVRAG